MIVASHEFKNCVLCVTSLVALCGCQLRSYPPTFVQSPASWHRIELHDSSDSDYVVIRSDIFDLLTDGWGAETGWTIDDAATSDKDIQTEWRYGYSCYRFGDYRRRILVRLASDETPTAVYVKTESARKDREFEFLWWGGKERGWIDGHDPRFQSAVTEEFRHRIAERPS